MVPVVGPVLVEEHGAAVVEVFWVVILVVAVVGTDLGPKRRKLVGAEADGTAVLGMRDVTSCC